MILVCLELFHKQPVRTEKNSEHEYCIQWYPSTDRVSDLDEGNQEPKTGLVLGNNTHYGGIQRGACPGTGYRSSGTEFRGHGVDDRRHVSCIVHDDSRTCIVLCRAGPVEECAFGLDAVLHDYGTCVRGMGSHWL